MNNQGSPPARSYAKGAVWGIAAALLLLVLLMIVIMFLFKPEMIAA